MRCLAVAIFLFVALCVTGRAQENQLDSKLTEAIVTSLKQIQTIKPGMTRGQLLTLFTTEGGLSTGLQRTYVYLKCPYIKVDVEFEAVGRPRRDEDGRVTLREDDRDLIKTISRPYLQWSIFD